MRIRYAFLSILLIAFIAPVHGQGAAGSSIVSRTLLSSDSTMMLERRVYDNGLGDIVQEVQSFPGSSLPSVVTHHEYDEHRRKTRTWLPVTTSGSGFVSGSAIASLAQSQYSDSAPFSHTVYDGFLPSQPSAQHMAGAQWQSHGKAVSYSEEEGVGMILNTLGEICIWISGDGSL